MTFEVKEVSNIMDEMEYPGIRFIMNAVMGKLVTPMKIGYFYRRCYYTKGNRVQI